MAKPDNKTSNNDAQSKSKVLPVKLENAGTDSSILASFVGREVTVKIKKGTVVEGRAVSGPLINGVCVDPGCGDTVKLKYAYESPGVGFEGLVYPKKMQINDLSINVDDIVTMSVVTGSSKRKFATDTEYHEVELREEDKLLEWKGGDDSLGADEAENNGGWSVEEMFEQNTKLGVKSTFKEDLTKYTTCKPAGSDADYQRAQRLAREIEKNPKSKNYAFLENDDEERDLDKATIVEDDAEKRGASANNRGAKNQKNYTGPINQRAEMLRTGTGGGQSKTKTASGEREFNRNNKDRQSFGKNSQPGQTFSSNEFTGRRNQYGDDSRVSPNQKSQTMMRRTDELRCWGSNFNNTFREPQGNNAANQAAPQPPQRVFRPIMAGPLPVSRGPPAQSAWTKGPPKTTPAPVESPPETAPAQVESPTATSPPAEPAQVEQKQTVEGLTFTATIPNNDSQGKVPTTSPPLSTTSASPPHLGISPEPLKLEENGEKKNFKFNPDAPSFVPSVNSPAMTPQQPPQPQHLPQLAPPPLLSVSGPPQAFIPVQHISGGGYMQAPPVVMYNTMVQTPITGQQGLVMRPTGDAFSAAGFMQPMSVPIQMSQPSGIMIPASNHQMIPPQQMQQQQRGNPGGHRKTNQHNGQVLQQQVNQQQQQVQQQNSQVPQMHYSHAGNIFMQPMQQVYGNPPTSGGQVGIMQVPANMRQGGQNVVTQPYPVYQSNNMMMANPISQSNMNNSVFAQSIPQNMQPVYQQQHQHQHQAPPLNSQPPTPAPSGNHNQDVSPPRQHYALPPQSAMPLPPQHQMSKGIPHHHPTYPVQQHNAQYMQSHHQHMMPNPPQHQAYPQPYGGTVNHPEYRPAYGQ
uniref:LsmAD domain-containing protein n=1 Tax=Panagrellus redivivus TaxID=6233 RepID=A0A7E4ZZK8_PANRE